MLHKLARRSLFCNIKPSHNLWTQNIHYFTTDTEESNEPRAPQQSQEDLTAMFTQIHSDFSRISIIIDKNNKSSYSHKPTNCNQHLLKRKSQRKTHLCKYNGAIKRRIVQSSTNTIVFGFWG
eukprot:388871_1